jgi:hypothetical protein
MRVIQGHVVPDDIEAAVTLELRRQIRLRYNNIRWYGLGTALFAALRYADHQSWAVWAMILAGWLTAWNLFLFFMLVLPGDGVRKEIEEQILSKAVANRKRSGK